METLLSPVDEPLLQEVEAAGSKGVVHLNEQVGPSNHNSRAFWRIGANFSYEEHTGHPKIYAEGCAG
eukprot:1137124-Pelagomonas_calceolata.AAC.2